MLNPASSSQNGSTPLAPPGIMMNALWLAQAIATRFSDAELVDPGVWMAHCPICGALPANDGMEPQRKLMIAISHETGGTGVQCLGQRCPHDAVLQAVGIDPELPGLYRPKAQKRTPLELLVLLGDEPENRIEVLETCFPKEGPNDPYHRDSDWQVFLRHCIPGDPGFYSRFVVLMSGQRWPRDARDNYLAALGVVDPTRQASSTTTDGTPDHTIIWQTASDLQREELPPLRWCIEGLLPEGVALLAGRPKKGKSLLALNIAVAKATGGKALGRYDVEPGDVAYLALEDGKRRVKTRIENLMPPGQPWPDRLSLTYAAPRIVVDASGKVSVDEGLLQALTGWIKEASNPSLTIVDILARVKPSQRTKGRGDIYQEDYELISAFVELAQKHGITILLVTHTSKRRSEDIFDDIMGTTGVSGGSSTNLVLQRLNDGSSLDGILHVTGKDAEDQSIGLSFDRGTWHAKGDAEAYQQSQERLELFEVLYTASGKGLTPKDLTEALDKKGGTVRKMLHTLREQGLVRGDEQGRYFLSDKGAAVIKAHRSDLSDDPLDF
jgi:hypothetical protein